MKKLYMCTIIGSSGKDCLNYFISTSWLGLFFESNLLWVRQYKPLNLHTAKELIQY